MRLNFYTVLAAFLLTTTSFAQAPEKLSYQAVVRDAGNALVSNQTVGMQVSVLQTTANGTAVYVETQTPSTNANGLVSIQIGMGNVVSGDFSGIDWSAGPYFIKTEIDPTGGANYTITGTSELLSVPYALYAETASNTFSGDYNDLTSKPVVNDFGDIKQGFQAADHNGWIKLDGRAVSTLTATQQTQVNLLGFSVNLPDATNAYLSQNEEVLGAISGANSKTINQNQLPNTTLTGTTSTSGNHTHNLRLSANPSGQSGIQSALITSNQNSSSSAPVLAGGNHGHSITTSSINGGVTQVDFDVKPQTMSVNVFIYLGN